MSPRSPQSRAAALRNRLIVVVGLWVFFALAVGAAVAKSPTSDEPFHITTAIEWAQTGEFHLNEQHPPLTYRLIGPLLFSEPTVPVVATLSTWPGQDIPAIAGELFWGGSLNVERTLLLGRLAVVWVGCLLGAGVALWTNVATRRSLAALAVVMVLYATSPNLLASATLATTDFITTAAYFASICAWWFHGRRPNWRRWLATGVLLGLALAAKITALLLIPVLVLLAYVYPRRGPWWRPGVAALALLPVAALTLWAVYGFATGPWHGLTVPAPAYWQSWEMVRGHFDQGHQAFFLGDLSGSGWLLYFPVAFLIKTPPAFLALLVAAPAAAIRHRASRRLVAFLLLPVAALFIVAMSGRLNIGYRHILPVVPLLLVAIGLGVPYLCRRRAGRVATCLAVVWAAAAALWIHPHHLAYFNELVGGPAHGYRYLGDSNLDWGQDLKGLAANAALAGDAFHYSYSGVGDPAYYGLHRPALSTPEGAVQAGFHPANPAPGHYAISATHVQGVLPDADLFAWFRAREPDGTINYSILLYDVAEAQPGEWIAHCLAPGRILTDEEAERLVDLPGARHLSFDCESAWVFPDDAAPGWYVLPARQQPYWIEDVLGETKPVPVYHHRSSAFGPAYAIYYWPGATKPAALLSEALDAPTGAGPAELRGYASSSTAWLTLWRVRTNTGEPLSVQGHLYSGDDPPQVADGLGFAPDQWRVGDWFIQRHLFSAPGETLETGLYNYATLEEVGAKVRLPAR